MTNTEFLAFLFVGFLSVLWLGIFLGIAMADKRKQRNVEPVKLSPRLEKFREEAFARTDGRRRSDILDAEVLD